MPKRQSLIVVANRLPIRRVGSGASARWERSPGGLVSAMEPVLERFGGTWVGWSGMTGRVPRPFSADNVRMVPVPISRPEEEHFYNGMSNRTFWPLYHDAVRTPEFNREWWGAYVEVNKRFARAAARAARRRDVVWIHDYQLQLVPMMLRELKPDLRIGFFMHVPFPPEELFAWLPWRSDILRGLLGADLVGFQTQAAMQNFSRLARRYTTATGTDSALEFEGRTVRSGSFPISIDFDAFDEMARDPEVVRDSESIRQRLGPQRKVVLSVDRLDYTKGIEHRLAAYADLLNRRQIAAEKCVLVQIAVPTRDPLPDYTRIRASVEHAVGRINGEHASPGRVAVHYFRRTLSRRDLVAWYLAADVMLVTPLRDGMNLVAKEYVACRTDHSGVLVLSEFAGAARELRRAVLVNPRDLDGMVAAINVALKMDPDEAAQSMSLLRSMVRRHDVRFWAESFLGALTE
ncbi:MAG: trehalose-6-phosphate synthase [Phycisphaeraceae bacterium]|nr:trehalose-6-phosphate synthase [Phycisphaeraceae bacterium]MBX3406454.1 trehalose-6-phosphate synthase [Phycisphaeraceae bacterium]